MPRTKLTSGPGAIGATVYAVLIEAVTQEYRKISDDTLITETAAGSAWTTVAEPATAGAALVNQTTYSIDFAALTHSAAARTFDRVLWCYQAGGSPSKTADACFAVSYDVVWDGTNLISDAGQIIDAIDSKAVVTVLPIQTTAQNTIGVTRDLELIQNSTPVLSFEITDADEEPVDLSAATLRFVVWSTDQSPLAPDFSIESADITVQGDDSNIVLVPLTIDFTTAAKDRRYGLWRLDSSDHNTCLGLGRFSVRGAVVAAS